MSSLLEFFIGPAVKAKCVPIEHAVATEVDTKPRISSLSESSSMWSSPKKIALIIGSTAAAALLILRAARNQKTR